MDNLATHRPQPASILSVHSEQLPLALLRTLPRQEGNFRTLSKTVCKIRLRIFCKITISMEDLQSIEIGTFLDFISKSKRLPFKSGYSGYSRVPGNFFDLPGNFRKILLFQKILVVNPKSQRHELVEVKSVSFPSKW